MPAFFEYIRNITYYLLFASLVSMAAPSGKYRQYVKLITGFILLLLVLNPLTAFVKEPAVSLSQWLGESSITGLGSLDDYEGLRDSSLREAFEEQLNAQLKELLNQNDYEPRKVEFTYKEDFSRIESITLTVSRLSAGLAKKPFIRIEPVRISSETEPAESEETISLKKLIAGFYSLPVEHIHLKIEG